MSDTNKEKTLAERMDEVVQRRRAEHQAKLDADLLARAEQVRTLQGMLGPVRMVNCPHCGGTLIDPRPIAPDDDYDTRM